MDMQGKILRLDRPLRVALLAECATRVLPIYEEYWVGTYDEEVARSIEIAWNFVLGSEINDKEFQSCLAELEDIVEFYYDEGISVLAKSVSVTHFLLQALFIEEEKSSAAVTQGLLSAVDAAASAEAMANSNNPLDSKKKVAVLEETRWQEEATGLAENWVGVPTRTMFDSLEGKPPTWFLDWQTRSHLEARDT